MALRTAGLDPAQLVSTVSAFGRPKVQVLREHRLAENPMVSVISSEQFDTRGDGRRVVFAGTWHTDDAYLAFRQR